MNRRENERKPILMMISSMIIFGTIGVFRRYIPVSSAFLAFARGLIGGLCILVFLRFRKKAPAIKSLAVYCRP